MSITNDLRMGVSGAVFAGRDEVANAVKKAADLLGSHAEVISGSAKVTVKFYPGLVRAMSRQSPIVGVTLAPGEGGSIVVRAKIERYLTIRQRMYWIPVSPKRLVGKSTAKAFFRSLKQELDAVDSGRGKVELLGL